MIKNYKQFESLLDKLEGPSEDDVWEMMKHHTPQAMLTKSARSGFLKGVKYALSNGASIQELSFLSFRKLIRMLNEFNETELLYDTIETFYTVKKNNGFTNLQTKDEHKYYYLISCMYGYLHGVEYALNVLKIEYDIDEFAGLELAIRYNRLNVVNFLLSHYEKSGSRYNLKNKAKEFTEKYDNPIVLDYILKKKGSR